MLLLLASESRRSNVRDVYIFVKMRVQQRTLSLKRASDDECASVSQHVLLSAYPSASHLNLSLESEHEITRKEFSEGIKQIRGKFIRAGQAAF